MKMKVMQGQTWSQMRGDARSRWVDYDEELFDGMQGERARPTRARKRGDRSQVRWEGGGEGE